MIAFEYSYKYVSSTILHNDHCSNHYNNHSKQLQQDLNQELEPFRYRRTDSSQKMAEFIHGKFLT